MINVIIARRIITPNHVEVVGESTPIAGTKEPPEVQVSL